MDGADTAWETAMEVYYHLHRNGFAGDKPRHVFKRRDLLAGSKDDSALGYIGDYMKHYIPDYVAPREFQEQGQRATDDLYRVTIYCSATSTNENFRKQAHDLSFDLASEGFAIKNGGGTDGLMVETSKGVHDFREWWQQNHPNEEMLKNHISSIQCEDTYKSEGLCSGNDYVCVHPNIFQRMADLTDTDAEIVLWGGAGTVQEMMGSIMLREAGITPSAGRPLVIVNAEIGNGIHKTRVFDPLIKAMPAWYQQKLNVHFVDTPLEALEIVREARRAAGREPGFAPNANAPFQTGPSPNGPA
jgi:predicted Rossmann-fold nucleotide-binding protein